LADRRIATSWFEPWKSLSKTRALALAGAFIRAGHIPPQATDGQHVEAVMSVTIYTGSSTPTPVMPGMVKADRSRSEKLAWAAVPSVSMRGHPCPTPDPNAIDGRIQAIPTAEVELEQEAGDDR